MAEYNKKRLFWIKLTDRFMSSDTVDYLMSQKDGANYVVLYQMLCLKTVNNEGILASNLGEIIIPYNEEKIVRDCKYFSIDTVRIALSLYIKLGLIYEQEDGMLRISDFDKLIGSTTEGAEKKQLQLERRRQNQEQLGGKQGGTKVENIPPEKDIDKDIDIDKEQKLDSKLSKERKKEKTDIVNHQCVRTHACEDKSRREYSPDMTDEELEEYFSQMTDEELLEFGEKPVDVLNDKNATRRLELFYNETTKRKVSNKSKWKGKITSDMKELQSHAEILDDFNLPFLVKDKMKEFLRYCYANGHLITNEQLESICLELVDNYQEEEFMLKAIQKAISGGYYDIKRFQ